MHRIRRQVGELRPDECPDALTLNPSNGARCITINWKQTGCECRKPTPKPMALVA